MSTPRLVILATLSIGVSLFLGLIDYETRSFWDLFTLGNLPALVFYAALAFTILLILSLLGKKMREVLTS